MNAKQFVAALRVMHVANMDDLVRAGVIDQNDRRTFEKYDENPWRWMMSTDDASAFNLFHMLKEHVGDL